jgi:hypothetical protein
MKKNLQTAITTWITAALVLTIGILCCVAGGNNESSADAYKAISMVLGIALIIVSGLAIVLSCLVLKRTATAETLGEGITLAAGIYFVADTALGGTLLSVLVEYVPFILLVVGSLFVVDAILILVFGIVKKALAKAFIIPFAVELVIGAVAIVLGALALPSVDVITHGAKFIILGIILIVYAAFLILSGVLSLIGKNVKNSDVNENVVEAEATEATAEEAKAE